MTPQPFSRARVERVIATVRVVLAGSSLFAVWFDPAEPARYPEFTYTLQAIYVVYALGLAAAMWRRDSTGRMPLLTHLMDVVVASVFQYLTLGPSSPFFTYFVFALFSAALRWGWQATVRTAALVLFMFIAIAISLSRTLGPSQFEGDRFIIRSVYLVVVAVVLVYLGQHEARLREEIRRLARWPVAAPGDWNLGVPKILDHAASIVGAGQVTVVWSPNDEPWVYVSSWPHPPTGITKVPPRDLEPIVHESLAESTFVCPGPATDDSPIEVSRAGVIATWQGRPVHPALLSRIGEPGYASAPFRTERLSGRVFLGGLTPVTADLMPLAEVVGREIGGSLDQLHAHEQSRRLAVVEDRIRLARDLHDGVLQSLTGIRLELRSMVKPDATGRRSADHDRLLALERALAIEQRELRRFIEDLKPDSGLGSGTSLSERLDELRRRLALEWRAPITIRVSPAHLSVPAGIDRSIPFMVHEAIVNALKHGQPSRVSVDVHSTGDRLRIIVSDDGRGFAFSGRQDQAALAASNAGPVSLRERVTSLGGDMVIDSTPTGSSVELSVPLGAVDA